MLELKQILAAAGTIRATIDNCFTQQTQFALAQWQAQHHYPNSTPAVPESVTVSLEQGTGYQLGDPGLGGPDHRPAGRADHRPSDRHRAAPQRPSTPYRPTSPATPARHHRVGGRPGRPGRAAGLRDHGRLGALDRRSRSNLTCEWDGRGQTTS